MGHVKLKEWFNQNQRKFPWREDRSPYRVWVSEVMLQQTRAKVVVDYFNAWMERFPTIEALASASEEEVVKQWEGLGYYSRARNLRTGAIYVVENYGGNLPEDPFKLLKIKGLGPYTAGAILSFAFGKKAAALDGNVMRVLSRFLAFEKEVLSNRSELEQNLLGFLPEKDPHIIMEALIELGATICQKEARCEGCPLKRECKAYIKNEVHRFPIKKSRPLITSLFRFVACIESENKILLRKAPKGEIMGGLYEFPFINCPEEDPLPSLYTKEMERFLKIPLQCLSPLTKQSHHFTRYHAHLYPFLFWAPSACQVEGYEWIPFERVQSLPFSSGHRKILSIVIAKK